jgi:hypothetical protein
VQKVGKDELIAALVALLQLHRPGLVRAMDPDPDHVLADKKSIQPSDHIDHTAAAEFAVAALGRYVAAGGRPPAVEHVRGYANQFWPANLPATVYDQKVGLIARYGGGGRPDCYQTMCGDLQLGEDTTIHYGYSTWPRYPAPTGWIRTQQDGSLTAVAALGGRATAWRRKAWADSAWSGPAALAPQGYIAPTLSMLQGPGGRLHLLALRRTAALDANPIIEVVWCAQDGSGSFGAWQSLGSVEPDDPVRSRETGIPVGAFDSTGVLSVFVRDFEQGVSCIQRSAQGSWGSWKQVLAPGPYQDGLAALPRRDGTVELYAAGGTRVSRLWQRRPGGPFQTDDSLGSVAPASPLTTLEDASGRVAVLFRIASSTDFAVCARSGSGPWQSVVVHGPGGVGPITATPWRKSGASGILLTAVAADGSPTLAAVSSLSALLSGATPAWHEPDSRVLSSAVAAAQGADEAITVCCLARDGRLWATYQDPAKLDAGFPAWSRVG